ncbi:hypothetical protein Scep_019594 [Stephania cephalantha]|uniref:Uncharacterized protein n=1 Tax=Stephania cephalantha TaxID=152367 RepID=A0AAP0NNG8_9MAGN
MCTFRVCLHMFTPGFLNQVAIGPEKDNMRGLKQMWKALKYKWSELKGTTKLNKRETLVKHQTSKDESPSPDHYLSPIHESSANAALTGPPSPGTRLDRWDLVGLPRGCDTASYRHIFAQKHLATKGTPPPLDSAAPYKPLLVRRSWGPGGAQGPLDGGPFFGSGDGVVAYFLCST